MVQNGRISNFYGLLTLTLTLDPGMVITFFHLSSSTTCIPNFIEIEETFLWTDGRTDGNLPPIVLGRLIKFGSRPKNGVVWGSYGSLKITGISAIRYSVYDFLLPFHSNYVPMHRFWDIARYWLKIADCNLPHLYLVPPLGVTPLEFRRDIWQQKTSPWAIVQSCLRDPRFSHFGTIPACDRRSRWTDGHPTVAWYL